jgi:hypothetical protein
VTQSKSPKIVAPKSASNKRETPEDTQLQSSTNREEDLNKEHLSFVVCLLVVLKRYASLTMKYFSKKNVLVS